MCVCVCSVTQCNYREIRSKWCVGLRSEKQMTPFTGCENGVSVNVVNNGG